jgi:putative ABC transport system permease protein
MTIAGALAPTLRALRVDPDHCTAIGMSVMDLYGLLLRLYPASFRNEYGSEMRAVFERRRVQTSGAVRWHCGSAPSAKQVVNAAAVHTDILRQDLSYTARMLRRSPGFALTAVVIVALGIGATTAAFSVTDFVLLRPLPFAEPERLVNIWERTPKYRNELSPPNFRDWTRAATVFERAAITHSAIATLVGVGDPVRVEGSSISHQVMPTLGVSPIMGRAFAAADDVRGAAGTVILSYALWQTQFGGDPSVLGRKILLSDEPYTVIGVMGREFRYPSPTATFWIPMRFGEADDEDRTNHWLYGVARLKRGVTLAQARAEMDVIGARSRQQYPVENKDVGIELRRVSDEVPDQSRILLYALSGASACVLLIACSNLANLLLARALARRRELAVRTAIGAGRERMVRQLMTESLVIAATGGMLGVATAFAAVPLLTRLVPVNLPLATEPTVDARVLVFAVILSVVTGLVFGLAPVLRLSGEADLSGLRDGSVQAAARRKERGRRWSSWRSSHHCLAGLRRFADACVADRAGDRARVPRRWRADDADAAGDPEVRQSGDTRGLLRTRVARHPGIAWRRQRGVRQLPADGAHARRRLAGCR